DRAAGRAGAGGPRRSAHRAARRRAHGRAARAGAPRGRLRPRRRAAGGAADARLGRARHAGGPAALAGVTTVVYGRHPVRELLRAGRRRVHEIFALPELAAKEAWLAEAGARPRTRAELGRLCGSSDHQGVVAVCDPYPYADARGLVEANGPLVCLDGVQDPHNVGAVARVAAAAGAAGLVIPRRGSPGVTAAACKTSAGAVEHLPIAQVDSLASFVHDARGPERWAVGAAARGGEDYRTAAWDEGTILVMGAEG